MRVLITRPKLFAESLKHYLKVHGYHVTAFPTIEIQATANIEKLQQSIQNLEPHDLLIFCSRPAVLYALPLIQQHWPDFLKRSLTWCAMGPGTAAALQAYKLKNILVPKNPPYESEALLALPEFEKIQNKKVKIFRGNAGRQLLSEVLRERAARVEELECYRRQLPEENLFENLYKQVKHSSSVSSVSSVKFDQEIKQPHFFDAIITTSPDALKNLKTMIPEKLWSQFCDIPTIIIGARMQSLAGQLGLRYPILAEGPQEAYLLQALESIRGRK